MLYIHSQYGLTFREKFTVAWISVIGSNISVPIRKKDKNISLEGINSVIRIQGLLIIGKSQLRFGQILYTQTITSTNSVWKKNHIGEVKIDRMVTLPFTIQYPRSAEWGIPNLEKQKDKYD